MNQMISKYTNMKKKGIQRMILSIVELFALFNSSVFLSNHHQGNVNM